MKNTNLTYQDMQLLEDAIVHYGDVASFDQLAQLTKMNRAYARKRISQLAEQGWLVRLKKGLYALSDLRSRGFLRLSPYVTAQLLVLDSYISFESALQYHGLYDQLQQTVVSITRKQHKTLELGGYTYRFVKTQEAFFYGWQAVILDGREAKIASAEKALIDLIMFHRTIYAVDLVLEILQLQRDELNFAQLYADLARSTTTVQRIFGFLFDLAGIDAEHLVSLVAQKSGVSTITNKSTLYDSKWRLYYEQYFVKYQENRANQ